MALSDALQSEIKKSSARQNCTVARIANELSEKDREVYLTVLSTADPRNPEFLSPEKLSRVLRSEGYDGASPSSISRHRKSVCSCFRSPGAN